MADFKLEVVAPEGKVVGADVQFVKLPSVEGELGILAHHTPLIGALKVGIIRYTKDEKSYRIATSGGFVEVANNKVTVLAETAEPGDLIDLERALAAKERAMQRINERNTESDIKRAEFALQRAINRIKAAEGTEG
ncbi:MAG: F0F1 ATP synthase subunit epsilon [Peptococcaceae bacterium]|nr:F0F1 ATP synthase subunit epsilon [Peptococcaceae bacterium]